MVPVQHLRCRMAQEQVLDDALTQAGIPPSEVDFLEVHGTGSQIGDPIEVNAAASVYGKDREADRPLLLGTVKTNIGHLESAAGVAGLIKVLLAMQRGVIPKHLNFENPNPYVDWSQLPVHVTSEKMDWPSRTDRPPRAGISAFAISGTNAHVVVEGHTISGYPELHSPVGSPEFIAVPNLNTEVNLSDPVDEDQRRMRLLPLSAKSDEALRALAERYLHWLDAYTPNPSSEGDPETLLADMAWTATVGRSHLSHRAGVVFEDKSSLQNELRRVADGSRKVPAPEKKPKLAFLFNDEDNLGVEMGAELYSTEPVVRAVLDQCDKLLQTELKGSLLDVMSGGSENLPDSKMWQSPVLFALQCAQVALWESIGVHPDVVFGIGTGELAAAYAASVLKLEEGLTLATRRTELMNGNLGDENVQSLLTGISLGPPSICMVSGITGLQVRSDVPLDKAYWARQAHSSVAFEKSIASIAEMVVTIVVEIGHEVLLKPKILSIWPKISNQTDTELQTMVLAGAGKSTKDTITSPKENFMHSVARLYETGLNSNFSGLFAGEKRSRISLPSYPFQHRHFWFEKSDLDSENS